MHSVFPASMTIFLHLDSVGSIQLVLLGDIISRLTLGTSKRYMLPF